MVAERWLGTCAGLLYRLSDREDWPELVGKITAAGRLIPAHTGGLFRVFDALRRLSGDEGRIQHVFKSFDRDKSGSLELKEVMSMCRQLAGLSYHEALFVQVRAPHPAPSILHLSSLQLGKATHLHLHAGNAGL